MNISLANGSNGEVLGQPNLSHRDEEKVLVVLSVDDFQKCCADLISHHIKFEVHYLPNASTETLPKPNYSPSFASNVVPASSNQMQIMKEIYQKYIEGDFSATIPTEREIALQHGINFRSFKSLFKKVYGQSFYQLYLEKRMEYASKLLKKGYKANEVATMIGYSPSSAIKFNKMFQKQYHMTPKKYQLQFWGKINRR